MSIIFRQSVADAFQANFREHRSTYPCYSSSLDELQSLCEKSPALVTFCDLLTEVKSDEEIFIGDMNHNNNEYSLALYHNTPKGWKYVGKNLSRISYDDKDIAWLIPTLFGTHHIGAHAHHSAA